MVHHSFPACVQVDPGCDHTQPFLSITDTLFDSDDDECDGAAASSSSQPPPASPPQLPPDESQVELPADSPVEDGTQQQPESQQPQPPEDGNDADDESPIPAKRKRGRPRKAVPVFVEGDTPPASPKPKKRGRPPKQVPFMEYTGPVGPALEDEEQFTKDVVRMVTMHPKSFFMENRRDLGICVVLHSVGSCSIELHNAFAYWLYPCAISPASHQYLLCLLVHCFIIYHLRVSCASCTRLVTYFVCLCSVV